MKKLIFVLLLSGLSFAYAQAIQMYPWGMSYEAVKLAQGEPESENYGATLKYTSFMAGQDATLGFFFKEDKLIGQMTLVSIAQYTDLLTVCSYLYGIPLNLKQNLVWRISGATVILGRQDGLAALVFTQEVP